MLVRPTLATQLGLIKACLRKEEVRRAHRWALLLIKNGCPQNPNYAPELVKSERTKFKSTWVWDVAGFIDTILQVVEALAAAENAHTAHEWLGYLVGCGLKPEEAYATWEKVRRVHPREIISTILSGEQADPLSPGLPPVTKLASLFGEGSKHARGSSAGSIVAFGFTSARSASKASCHSARTSTCGSPNPNRDRAVSSMSGRIIRPKSARTSLSDTGRRSGAASPSLRKFLDAKNRGATPSLSWARGAANSPGPLEAIEAPLSPMVADGLDALEQLEQQPAVAALEEQVEQPAAAPAID